jgi:hypothetical protein
MKTIIEPSPMTDSVLTKRPRLMLIPGSMIAAPSLLKSQTLVEQQMIDGGFVTFFEEIEAGEVGLFQWYDSYDKLMKINPLGPLAAYINDRERVSQPELQLRLKAALEASLPEVIVTHSKGCQLVLETFIRYGLAPSVKKIVFMQSDDDATTDVSKLAQEVELIHLYAKDDATLWSSILLNGGKVRAGLVECVVPGVKNKPYKSNGIHISTLQDLELKEWILSL